MEQHVDDENSVAVGRAVCQQETPLVDRNSPEKMTNLERKIAFTWI
jgi:hypothetical protein